MPDSEGFPDQQTVEAGQNSPGLSNLLAALYAYFRALFTTATTVIDATITAGDATGLSTAVAVGSANAIALQMPDSWVTAALSFQTSLDGGDTYQDAYDKNGEISLAASDVVAASRNIHIDPLRFGGATHIKIRSGLSGAAVPQTSTDRIISVSVRRFH